MRKVFNKVFVSVKSGSPSNTNIMRVQMEDDALVIKNLSPFDIYEGNYPDWYRPHLHKKRPPSSQDCNVSLPPESYIGVPMRDRCFEVSGNKWKIIEPFKAPFGVPCYIHWNGWETRAQDLLERDWVITVVTNNFTKKKKLYVRDPVTKLMGAGRLIEKKSESGLVSSWNVDFNYFCHEKNQHIKKFIQQVQTDSIIKITEENIPAVLGYIADLQRENKRPKRRKEQRTPAEILELIRIAA